MSGVTLRLWAWAMGCGEATDGPRPQPIDRAEASAVLLTEHAFAELEIPADSRGGVVPPTDIPVPGPWQYAGVTRAGMHRWEAPLPIRPRGLFFHRAEPGIALKRTSDGRALAYDRFGKAETPTWSHDREHIVVYTPNKADEPAADSYALSYPKADARERSLNLAWSGKDDAEAFTRTTINEGWDHRSGLLLPAPGKAAWTVAVPKAAELHMVVGLARPEVIDGAPSDGAELTLVVEAAGTSTEIARRPLTTTFAPLRADMSAWAGQTVTLRATTSPGASPRFDYAFLAEPVIATRTTNPRRVLLVFIDTLRPDHLSMNGYERPTSPRLDAFAEGAAVFTEARSIAPWTLPSARTVLTGRQPEWYAQTATLQSILRKNGYTSAMFAGNVYLSANFSMDRDWDLHRVGLWPLAETTTNDALAWLDEHEGRDALLQVHYMSCHLPYTEPDAYRNMFAGETQGGLREQFHLSDVRQAAIHDNEAAKDYVKGRYDNNIRYATDQVGRLLDRMGPDDIVVIYADHGEEFWDHKGFEHGHTLYDELLRVPLIVRAPGVPPGRHDGQASLLDVFPTVLDALDIAHEPVDGISLLPVAMGDASAKASLEARNLAFGRPLYGMEQWGVLHNDVKWWVEEGREAAFDHTQDAAERTNTLKADPDDRGAPYRAVLSEVLNRPVNQGFRLVTAIGKGAPTHDLVVTATLPGGIAAAWLGADPLEGSKVTLDHTPGSPTLTATWHRGAGGTREVFFTPTAPLAEATPTLEVRATFGDAEHVIVPSPTHGVVPGAIRTPLGRAALPGGRNLLLTWGLAPQPDPKAGIVEARDDEMNEALEALGYKEADAEPAPDRPKAKAARGSAR